MTALRKKIQAGLSRRFDKFIRGVAPRQKLSLKLVDNFKEFGGVEKICSLTDRRTRLSPPQLLDTHLVEIRQSQIEVASPDVHLLEFRDVQVVGLNLAIIRGDKAFHPELSYTEPTHDYKTPDLCQFESGERKRLAFNVHSRPLVKKRIKVGFHLLKEHSYNYYHWLAECLPRLAYFCENVKRVQPDQEIFVLIDSFLGEQYKEAIRRIINFPFRLQVVRRGELVHCDRLFYVSPFWYALDNSKHQVDPQRDFAVDKFAIEVLRCSCCPAGTNTKPSRKIYLPRVATQVRRIINAPEVEQVMRENGFEIIHAHQFTFAQQVELFASVKIIVGATGAAFSNMVFMQPGSKAVIISPKQLEVFNYYIFQQHADVAGVELMHLLAVPEKHDGFFVHDDFSVNCDDLRALLKRLN